ncbi:hypothetical protein [Nodularia sp. NIES-3585]|uniref:hypothetical protein n=1 Tax=Nodularia sp. NIES-3585 TaxID=1973477 RepID=UPI000B5CD096|nr:hypothetical protein [Nodularia sp. NIES-3585]GAX38083.1 hypothetical protein NIES3585_41300 [Nodularia sp. NIES-3585]
MNNYYANFSLLTLSLLLLLDPFHIAFSAPTSAQTSNCQPQNVELQIISRISDAEQAINDGKSEQAVGSISQAIQIALTANNPRLTSNFLNQLLDSEVVQDSLLGKLMQQAEPSQKAQVNNLLTSLTRLTQSLHSGYSFVKTKSLTRIANYSQSVSLLPQALAASKFIQGNEFKTKALTPIAQEYLAFKQTAPAESILNQSLQFARRIETKNPLRQIWVLEPIAITYAQLGKTESALQIVPGISQTYYRSRILFEVVKQLAKTNQLAAAQKQAQNIQTSEFKSKSLVEIAIAFSSKRQDKLAASAFNAALQVAGNDSNANYAQAPLIQLYARRGQRDAAYAAAKQLQIPEQQAVTLGIIANEYSQAGQVQTADKIITEMIPLIQTPEGLDSVGYVQNILANAITDQQYKLAFDLWHHTKVHEFIGRENWLLRIADAAIKAGKMEVILPAAQSLDQAEIEQRHKLLQKVAYGYAQNKQIDKALAITQQISNAGSLPYRVDTLALIAGGSGKTPQTDKILTQAVNEARKLAPSQRAVGLASVAQAFFKLQNQQQGNQFIGEAIKFITTEQNSSVPEEQLLRIADSLIAAKQYSAALQIVKAMPTETQSYKLLELAKISIENGGEAIDIVKNIHQHFKTPESKSSALITVAETYIRTQKVKLAKDILDLAFVAAKTIPDPESRVLTFGSHPDVTVIDDDSDRASSLEKIALLKAQVGDYNQAVRVAEVIQDKKLRDQVMQQLICYRR